jgi:electron transfer flavoprotein alpha subunit
MSSILVVAEHRYSEVQNITFEMITAAREMANGPGDEIHLAVIGLDMDELTDTIELEPVDTVYSVKHSEEYNHDVYLNAIKRLAAKTNPRIVLMPHTVSGLDYAPAVAGELEIPIVTNAVGVSYSDTLEVTRKVYESKVDLTLNVDTEPVAITLREGALPAEESKSAVNIESVDIEIMDEQIESRVIERRKADSGDIDITNDDFIVCIGRGIEDEENIELVEELCDVTGATLAGSRPIIEKGWLPKERQVGQSGQVVSPNMYVAIGLSGAIEHVVGMKGSDTIIAINTDPDAPIFDIADYGIVGDLFDVVPEMIDAVTD